jgi:hypothetical protein
MTAIGIAVGDDQNVREGDEWFASNRSQGGVPRSRAELIEGNREWLDRLDSDL